MQIPGMETIKDWTPSTLTKWLRDVLNNNPPDFLPNLNAVNVTATGTLRVKDKMEYTKEPRFRKIGGTGQPAFQNSWVNYDTTPGWQHAGFWKDPLGMVHLRGLVKDGTLSNPIFTLPPGHRPMSGSELFCTYSSTGAARIDVMSDGRVLCLAGGTAYLSLSGISFRTS